MTAARGHADACEQLFRRELGRPPRSGRAPGGRRACRAEPGRGRRSRGRVAAARGGACRGGRRRGRARCGVSAAGVCRGAGRWRPGAASRALAMLGAELVHSVRGGDEEGAAMLHEALALAEAGSDREVECRVCRELGFVAVQASRGCREAGGWAGPSRWRRTTGSARPCSACAAKRCPTGPTTRRRSVCSGSRSPPRGAAATSGRRHGRWRSWAARCCCGPAGGGGGGARRLARARGGRGLGGVQPFPEALRAEVALRQGDPDRAIALLDHAFALGCRIGDPAGRQSRLARAGWSTRPRASASRRCHGCATPRRV